MPDYGDNRRDPDIDKIMQAYAAYWSLSTTEGHGSAVDPPTPEALEAELRTLETRAYRLLTLRFYPAIQQIVEARMGWYQDWRYFRESGGDIANAATLRIHRALLQHGLPEDQRAHSRSRPTQPKTKGKAPSETRHSRGVEKTGMPQAVAQDARQVAPDSLPCAGAGSNGYPGSEAPLRVDPIRNLPGYVRTLTTRTFQDGLKKVMTRLKYEAVGGAGLEEDPEPERTSTGAELQVKDTIVRKQAMLEDEWVAEMDNPTLFGSLESCKSELSDTTLEVITLWSQKKTLTEIAELLHTNLTRVYRLKEGGLETLRKCLARRGIDNPYEG